MSNNEEASTFDLSTFWAFSTIGALQTVQRFNRNFKRYQEKESTFARFDITLLLSLMDELLDLATKLASVQTPSHSIEEIQQLVISRQFRDTLHEFHHQLLESPFSSEKLLSIIPLIDKIRTFANHLPSYSSLPFDELLMIYHQLRHY